MAVTKHVDPSRESGSVIDVWFSQGGEYSRLSNLARRPFILDAYQWSSVEQYFQWKKAMTFKDFEIARRIRLSDDPYEARRLGRLVKGFKPFAWEQMKESLIEKAILASFEQNPAEADFLRSLGSDARFSHTRGGDWAEVFPRILKRVQETLLFGPKQVAALKEKFFDAIHYAYNFAEPSSEVIRGKYSREFSGQAHWSRSLDLKSDPRWPEMKGLRYVDFTDCTLARVILRDGESVSVEDLSCQQLGIVCEQLVHCRRLDVEASESKDELRRSVRNPKRGGGLSF